MNPRTSRKPGLRKSPQAQNTTATLEYNSNLTQDEAHALTKFADLCFASLKQTVIPHLTDDGRRALLDDLRSKLDLRWKLDEEQEKAGFYASANVRKVG